MTPRSDDERLERMRQVWRAAAPEASEVARARRRFVARQIGGAPSSRWLVDAGVGLAAVALAIVVVHPFLELGSPEPEGALSRAEDRVEQSPVSTADAVRQQSPSAAEVREAVTALGPSHEAPHLERQGNLVPLTPGIVYEVFPGESVALVVSGERHEIRGPKFVELSFEADRASGFRVHLSDVPPSARSPRPAPSPVGPDGPAPRATGGGASSSPKRSSPRVAERADEAPIQTGAWRSVADALQRGDRLEAERRLSELAADPAGAGNDSAALALAQLWIARGERERAEPVLQRLSREARSDLVRRRALELSTR